MVSVLGLAVMGGPLLEAGRPADAPLTIRSVADIRAIQEVAAARSLAVPLPGEPGDPLAWFVPGGRNQGTEDLAMALASMAMEGNQPLYLSDTWGRTSGSTRSDHHVANSDAWAIDLAVRGIQSPTPQTEEAARRVATALGHPGWTGGDLKVTIQGYRFQVLWRVAGHFNHVHVGIKKV